MGMYFGIYNALEITSRHLVDVAQWELRKTEVLSVDNRCSWFDSLCGVPSALVRSGVKRPLLISLGPWFDPKHRQFFLVHNVACTTNPIVKEHS